MKEQSMIDSALATLFGADLRRDEPMSRHTTLRVGGPAKWYWPATDVEKLASALIVCTEHGVPYLLIGHGSNLLVSDLGYRGLIIQNRTKRTEIPVAGTSNIVYAECGASLGSLFLQTANAGLSGLEWAVGIPGTVGGALVSNAGAYRGNIGPLVRSIRVFHEGHDLTVEPEWMEFAYRDSRLRRAGLGRTVVLSCTLELTLDGDPDRVLARSRLYQEQRKSKQPFSPSAGSFFKNVLSQELADALPGLPQGLKEAGVVPAGYIIEAAGLKGRSVGGAQSSERHANFLINTGSATAADFQNLAAEIKAAIKSAYGVELEEEVLCVGE